MSRNFFLTISLQVILLICSCKPSARYEEKVPEIIASPLSLKDSIFRNFRACSNDSLKSIIYRVDEFRSELNQSSDEVLGYTDDKVLIEKFLDSFPVVSRVNGEKPSMRFYSFAWLYFVCGSDTMELYIPLGCGDFSCNMGLFETDCNTFHRALNLIRLPKSEWKPYRKTQKKSGIQ